MKRRADVFFQALIGRAVFCRQVNRRVKQPFGQTLLQTDNQLFVEVFDQMLGAFVGDFLGKTHALAFGVGQTVILGNCLGNRAAFSGAGAFADAVCFAF